MRDVLQRQFHPINRVAHYINGESARKLLSINMPRTKKTDTRKIFVQYRGEELWYYRKKLGEIKSVLKNKQSAKLQIQPLKKLRPSESFLYSGTKLEVVLYQIIVGMHYYKRSSRNEFIKA